MSFSGFDISTATNIYLGSSQCSEIYIGSTKLWPLSHDYSRDYLTIVSLEDNNKISWKAGNANLTKTISISTDGGTTWTQKTSDTTGVTLATLNTDNKMLVKGNNTAYANSSYYNYFISSGNFNVEGNIMSLIYEDNFIGQTTLDSSGYNFYDLFYNCSKLISTENLILPATTLATGCYQLMFWRCFSLTTPPSVLPATTLSDYCYYAMFQACSSLTTAPALPATTLTSNCYRNMFQGCSSLTTAPALPAITLANNCYREMFINCTTLTAAPELPVTTLESNCYYGMFQGCSSLTTAPELLATTLTNQCYRNMFRNCANLNYIKCLATDISATNCTNNWVNGVSGSGTFVKDASMTSWSTGVSGIPSGWTIQNA